MSYLISLILLLLPTYLLRFSVLGIPTTVLEILIYLIFLYGLWRIKKEGFRKIPVKIILPIAVLIIALIISIVIAPDKRTALGELKGFFIDPILVFWLVFQFVKKEDVAKLFGGLITAGAYVSIHTIIERILQHTTPDGRVIGIFGYSPNYLALFLVPITVMLAAYSFQLTAQKRWPLAGFSYWLIVLNLLAIYFSGSRGGFLAVAGGVGIFFILNFWPWIRKRLWSQIIIGILILMSLYTAWVFFRPDFSASLERGRVVTSNNLRWQIWEASIELGAKDPLWGVGLGNFQNAFGEFTKNRGNFPEYITPVALTPHNIFLMFWLSTGILGLVSFIWLLVIFFKEGVNKINSRSAQVLLAIMASIIAYGLIESSIWKNDLSIIFWTIWGLIWAEENAKIKVQKPASPSQGGSK